MPKHVPDTFDQLLIQKGYERRSGYAQIPIYVRPDTGICKYYAPHIMRRAGQIKIAGSVGYFSQKFEEYWMGALKRRGILSQNTLMFSKYLTNFPEFFETVAVADSDLAGFERNINKIDDLLASLPNKNDEEFCSDVALAVSGGSEYKFWLGNKVKILYFRSFCCGRDSLDTENDLKGLDRNEMEPYAPMALEFEETAR